MNTNLFHLKITKDKKTYIWVLGKLTNPTTHFNLLKCSHALYPHKCFYIRNRINESIFTLTMAQHTVY